MIYHFNILWKFLYLAITLFIKTWSHVFSACKCVCNKYFPFINAWAVLAYLFLTRKWALAYLIGLYEPLHEYTKMVSDIIKMLGYLRQSQDKCITICMYLFFFFLLNDMYVPVNLYPFCVNILFLTVHIFARGHTCSINCITMPILYDDAQYHAVYWGPRKQIFIPVPCIF